MKTNIFPGSIISTLTMWVSATQGEIGVWPENGKLVGTIIVTSSTDRVTTTYNAEVIITDEISQHYSGIPISS
jgi:hypothetical protein